jgi:hypothetical protein
VENAMNLRFDHAGQTYTLRPVGAEAEAELLALYEQCNDFLALGPRLASLEMVKEDLVVSAAAGCAYCGVYDSAGRLVAVVDVQVSGYRGDPASADLALLMIPASQRSRGLGEAIFRAVEAEIRRVGPARELQ